MTTLKTLTVGACGFIPPPNPLLPQISTINREDITITNCVKNWPDAYMGIGGSTLDEKRHSSRLT